MYVGVGQCASSAEVRTRPSLNATWLPYSATYRKGPEIDRQILLIAALKNKHEIIGCR